ncbi:MAG: hypothetical protein WCF08_06670, partial [Anaerolineaceae bacterium]
VILIECKCFNKPIGVTMYLAFLARVIDIKAAPTFSEKSIQGIIATNVGIQKGVNVLESYYQEYVINKVIYSYGYPSSN